MVKKIIMNLDLSKASSPDSILVVVLRNCELELSYLRMLGKGLGLKPTALLVFFLWLVKSLKNL